MKKLLNYLLALVVAAFSCHVLAAPLVPIRVGVLEFGTVNWELEIIRLHDLAKKRGIDLKIVPLASGDASTIALQGGAVDVIVSDWLWVSRQRADAKLFSFVTYSNAVGTLVVPADSAIKTIADLQQKKIGVSGGPSDKIWLLLRAYTQRKMGLDLTKAATPTYGAPPLLNELMQRNQLDAVLNTWPFTTRLEAKGMHALIELPEILKGLGVAKPIPLIGWVFREDWANANKKALNDFFEASQEAKTLLLTSDDEWQKLRSRMRADDEALFIGLRNKYRQGIPKCLDTETKAAVQSTFKILADIGGEKLIGKSTQLAEGTFWPGYQSSTCGAP